MGTTNRFSPLWLCLTLLALLSACNNKAMEQAEVEAPKPAPKAAPVVAVEPEPLEPEPFPSHCKEGETSYLNARLQTVDRNTEDDGLFALVPTTDVLSLCYQAEPIGLSYRIGQAGNVTFEQTATTEQPFGTYFRRMGDISENMVFFSVEDKIFYVVESGGIASGVTLYTYQGDVLESEMFSGNIANEDFELNFIDIPEAILAGQEPPHETMY